MYTDPASGIVWWCRSPPRRLCDAPEAALTVCYHMLRSKQQCISRYCSSSRTLGGSRASKSLDVIFRGAEVYDGAGNAAQTADVGVQNDRIAAIGSLDGSTGALDIDASGLALCPGLSRTRITILPRWRIRTWRSGARRRHHLHRW